RPGRLLRSTPETTLGMPAALSILHLDTRGESRHGSTVGKGLLPGSEWGPEADSIRCLGRQKHVWLATIRWRWRQRHLKSYIASWEMASGVPTAAAAAAGGGA